MQASMDKAREVMEETGQERETRSKGHFRSAEKDLPKHLGSRFNIPLLDNVSSFLGGYNKLSKDVDPATECVWLLDNTAYRPVHTYPHAPQPFQAEFVAAYFKKNTGKDVSKAVAQIADKIGLGKSGENKGEAEKTIARRLQPFVDTIAPARSVTVKFPDGSINKLGPCGRSAVSEQTFVKIREHRDGESVCIPAADERLTPYGPMTMHYADPEGWLVVSGTHLEPPTLHCRSVDVS